MSGQQVSRCGGDAVPYALDSHGVVTVSLNRPESRNAIDDVMIDGLLEALAWVDNEPAARCVVLTSTHEAVFSAGGNLKGFAAEESIIDKHARNGRLPGVIAAMMRLKVPILCALNGHALAGGLGLVLACDLVLAREGIRVGTPEINVGVFPFMISTLMLRNIPRKRVCELVFLGEQLSAEEALELGIVNRVVDTERFAETVADWSQRLASKSPLMLKLGKRALFETQDLPLDGALALLQHYLTLAQGTDDVKEGVAAFMEKRPPVWRGA